MFLQEKQLLALSQNEPAQIADDLIASFSALITYPVPKSYHHIHKLPQQYQNGWYLACQKEILKNERIAQLSVVPRPPKGVPVYRLKWVFTYKIDDILHTHEPRARLVVRGDLIDSSSLLTFSPVASPFTFIFYSHTCTTLT